jgi:hypothetical protein
MLGRKGLATLFVSPKPKIISSWANPPEPKLVEETSTSSSLRSCLKIVITNDDGSVLSKISPRGSLPIGIRWNTGENGRSREEAIDVFKHQSRVRLINDFESWKSENLKKDAEKMGNVRGKVFLNKLGESVKTSWISIMRDSEDLFPEENVEKTLRKSITTRLRELGERISSEGEIEILILKSEISYLSKSIRIENFIQKVICDINIADPLSALLDK